MDTDYVSAARLAKGIPAVVKRRGNQFELLGARCRHVLLHIASVFLNEPYQVEIGYKRHCGAIDAE